MGEEMQAVLLGSVITALGILSYHHPNHYRTLAPYLSAGSALVGIGMFIWTLAVDRAAIAFVHLIGRADIDEFHMLLAGVKPGIWPVIGITIGGPLVFGGLLIWIGTLKEEQP